MFKSRAVFGVFFRFYKVRCGYKITLVILKSNHSLSRKILLFYYNQFNWKGYLN